jgi:ATP-dependent DNA ligase
MLYEIEKQELFYLGADGKMRHWTISVSGYQLVIMHGHLNGAMQTQYETISVGKAGRSQHQQIISRMRSRVNAQKLKGYKDTIEEAALGPSNVLSLKKPMLAQVWQKVKGIDTTNALVQHKYDGNRCLVTKQNGELKAYTRNGKYIETIDHILAGMQLDEGQTIDGELYCHGATLQEIVSWIKRKQPNTQKLRYHVYDMISDDVFMERYYALKELELGDYTSIVPTWTFESIASLPARLAQARDDGYEGLIVRLDGYGYEDAKRSKSLLKVKQFFDCEVEVYDVYRSAKGMPMLKCIMPTGEHFDIVAPGAHQEKEAVLNNPLYYIHKPLTIEYSAITKDGMPFHPIARRWRDDV